MSREDRQRSHIGVTVGQCVNTVRIATRCGGLWSAGTLRVAAGATGIQGVTRLRERDAGLSSHPVSIFSPLPMFLHPASLHLLSSVCCNSIEHWFTLGASVLIAGAAN